MSVPAALELASVSKSFGAHAAVRELSLRLAPGEVYALLGPNGAGKTTTLNLILGFQVPDAGQILIGGVRTDPNPMLARSRVAYLPETVMLHPHLSARENLRYFALLAGQRLDHRQAACLLREAGLQEEAVDRRASGFSKGMRQKVGVAVALAKHADVLLLDEPTSGLDASAANDFSVLVRATAERGIAVLMATHDLFRVKDVAHRLGILRAGRLIRQEQAASLSPLDLEAIYLQELAA